MALGLPTGRLILSTICVKVQSTVRNVAENGEEGINIETNFYEGAGSKPSAIVGEYTDRNRLLNHKGWKFIWLTDGGGWRKMKNPLLEGIRGIDYVINVCMLRDGILGKILS